MKKSKFRRVLTVFLAILGVFAVLFGCLSPFIFQRDKSFFASAEGASNPISVTIYWHNSLLKSASMVDSSGNTVTFSNGVPQSPQLVDGQTYTVSFSRYSGSDPVTKVVCDNPYVSVGVPNPKNNTFTFTYNVGGLDLLFGIITDSSSYDYYETIYYGTSSVPSEVLYIQTEDSLMPRTFYPDKSYDLYVSSWAAGTHKIFNFSVFPSPGFIFLNATEVGTGSISQINNQDSTFVQTFPYQTISQSSLLTITVLDISSWTDEAYNKGHSAGYQNGYDDGYETGHEDGYNDGLNDNSQYQVGYNSGYQAGYTDGTGVSYSNLNVVSLFLSPVNAFLATPLFGSFSFGTAFSVVLVVLLGAIFIKMFAGG